MAIDLPGEVVSFRNFIGMDRPSANEDTVREFDSHVREFAGNIQSTHQDSMSVIGS